MTLPSLALTDIDGRAITAASLNGRAVVASPSPSTPRRKM